MPMGLATDTSGVVYVCDSSNGVHDFVAMMICKNNYSNVCLVIDDFVAAHQRSPDPGMQGTQTCNTTSYILKLLPPSICHAVPWTAN